MIRKSSFFITVVTGLFSLQGCDDLTTREETVTLTLDTFNLVGNATSHNGTPQVRATVTGNPACTATQTSLNSLLAQTSNFDEIDEFLESLDVNAVQYRILENQTAVEASGMMLMTNPTSGALDRIGEITIPANQIQEDWTVLPFVDDGGSTLNHYLNNRDAEFLYCFEGSPDSAELSMSVQLQMDLTVTVDLL